MDYELLRYKHIVQQSGPACPCGGRSWKRGPVRDPDRRLFRCAACHTVINVLNVSSELFLERKATQQQTA